MSKKPYKKPPLVYAGIGNRDTPQPMLNLITAISRRLSKTYVLRTGAAVGADRAFMEGTMKAEIYVPWHNYEGFPLNHAICKAALKEAEQQHPSWKNLTQGVRNMHGRNMQIIAGPHMEDYVDFVLCFTRDGCDSVKTRSMETGGTGSAISFADSLGIPVINLANAISLDQLTIFSEIDFTDMELPNLVTGF